MPLAAFHPAVQDWFRERVGGGETLSADVRIVAATNLDLEARARSGSFRADLLFRLNALTVRIPPLRERGDDALLIARATLARVSGRTMHPRRRLAPDAVDAIRRYDWPGNARELINAVRRASILCDEPEISAEHLGIRRSHAAEPVSVPAAAREFLTPENGAGLMRIDFSHGPVTLESIERQLIIDAMRHARGNVSYAAKLIGLNRGALRYRIDRLGLASRFREGVSS